MTNNKTQWEIERGKQDKLNNLGMSKLTPAQLKTILETHFILTEVLETIRDLHDLNLSEIRKLDDCKWQLYNNFNIEEKE
tara:strand:- start:359 stop:598 length:240 start_codon:yes stop_codon:yes gene_type:complete